MELTERVKQIIDCLENDSEIFNISITENGKAIRFGKKSIPFMLYVGDFLISIATVQSIDAIANSDINDLNRKLMLMSASIDNGDEIDIRYNFLMPNFDPPLFKTIIKFATDETHEFLPRLREEVAK